MGRREDRLLRKLEKDPAMECNKVRQKYCPDLFQDFANTKDPRNLSYTDYSNREMLGTMFYKGIAGITSMQAMTDEFNKDRVVKNLYRFMGEKKRNSCRTASRSMNILRGWTRKSCRKYSRSRFMDWSAAKRFMMRGSGKSGW